MLRRKSGRRLVLVSSWFEVTVESCLIVPPYAYLFRSSGVCMGRQAWLRTGYESAENLFRKSRETTYARLLTWHYLVDRVE